MAKVTNDKNLPLGVAIEPSHVAGNLGLVATSLSGNVAKDQRQQNQSVFSVSWFFALTTGNIGTVSSEQLSFMLPPLQTNWNDNLVSDENTDSVVLDSISFSFDMMNQSKMMGSNGLPSTGDPVDVKLTLYKLANDPDTTEPPPDRTPIAEVVITGEELLAGFNTRNPSIIRDLGVNIDRWSVYQWEIDASSTPLYSVWIRGNFTHPLVERDTAAVLKDALGSSALIDAQNAPASALYNKDNDAVTITAPAADTLIKADFAATGVQTQIETIDTKFLNKLVGGRSDRYQSDEAFATDRKEQITEDSGYFCWCVNLMKLGQAVLLHGNNVLPFQVDYPNSGGYALWDRALIPITYPGTIHHVILEAAGINDYIRKNPGGSAVSFGNRHVEVGVGLYHGVRVAAPTYQQVAHLDTSLADTAGRLLKERLWSVPLVYSTAAGSVAGKGFVTQGRPVYFGRQLTYDGTVARANIASAVGTSTSEAAPSTGGYENFIEIRLAYYRHTTGASWETGAPADLILSNAGFNVYIIGKMGLKE